ncbi:protease synthase and sporulation negative regulatory protein pai 1 [Companilactobacillus nodensis DSM 19682 = JCM 14932 = NBRC 107160]|uniref:Protease synthase and sporulation negative regulatory protein pai 1 n=2 Tax=Companilactobacillus nodensis TaxID=460870 RepID=A0A0R1K831_9LACO|nr:protease synthase and sporulation negative regulatory protein pai 1 [Companilactobacillus nodensis DSM 19682 = JCM 14932 = NBRC 107160]
MVGVVMEDMKIHRCTIEDLKSLQEISRQTFAETFGPYNTDEHIKEYLERSYNDEVLGSELRESNSEFYFLMFDGKPVAYLKLNFGMNTLGYDAEEGNMELQRIYVLKEYYRHGFGKILFDKAVQEARDKKRTSICLGVWEHNDRALSFYTSMGFKKVSSHIFHMGDKPQTDYVLNMELN